MRRILDGARRRAEGAWGDGGCVLLAALAIWLVLAWPLATGERTFVLRDVLATHLPLKSFGAAELAHGRIPAVNPSWAGGQPFRGNPNALPFYPGNLLYLLLPFWSAFGLHYVGHWLLAFLGMRRLGRELGQSRPAALVAALAYAGSGYLLTTLTFMNLLTVAAWAPWTLAGLARGGRRGTLFAGVACGMMLLGGEPLSAALVVPAMAIVAVAAHGARRGVVSAAAAGGVGLLVALPQLVATARVLPFSVRAAEGLPAAQSVAQALHPARLLELVWPLPWGWPSDLGRFAYWAPAVTPQTPYVYSLHFGLVACVLAAFGGRRARPWALLALASLAAAWAFGLDAGWTSALTGGIFRYPQKLLFPFTLAAALLAGFGVERALARPRPARPWLALAAIFGVAALALGAGQARFAGWLRAHLVIAAHDGIARTQAAHWWLLAIVATLVALAAAWAASRRSAAGLAAAQLAALLPLAPIWVTDTIAPYRAPAPLGAAVVAIGAPRTVAHAGVAFPPWEPSFPLAAEAADPVTQARWARAALEPPFAALDGVEQLLAPDLEGIRSPRTAYLDRRLAAAGWPERERWLRRLGAAWLVRSSPAAGPAGAPVAVETRFGARAELWRLAASSPFASWPAAVRVLPDLDAAWRAAASGETAAEEALASRPVAHAAGGAVALVAATPDRVELAVDSGGGLAVVRRAFLPIYRARLADGTPLATQPVDVALLGVEVPAGRQSVVVDVAAWPEALAGAIALATLALASALAWRRP